MIPANAFTAQPQFSSFTLPNGAYVPLSQTVMGGIAINNAANGRLYQRWVGYYDGTNVKVKPEGGVDVFTQAVAGITAVSLAFDNNMGIVLAWQTLAGSYLYYYDTLLSAYNTRSFLGTTSCRVCVDDPRDFYTASSDVIFAYTQNENLYWRQQRDRYDVERIIGATTKKLIKAGPSVSSRLQFELR